MHYSIKTTFICTRKPKQFCDSPHYNVCFIEVVQKQTHRISEVCLYTDLSLNSLFCYLIYLTTFKPKPTSFFFYIVLLPYFSSPIFSKLFELFKILSISIWILRQKCRFLQKILLWFLLGLCWIYRYNLETHFGEKKIIIILSALN